MKTKLSKKDLQKLKEKREQIVKEQKIVKK